MLNWESADPSILVDPTRKTQTFSYYSHNFYAQESECRLLCLGNELQTIVLVYLSDWSGSDPISEVSRSAHLW